MNDLFFFQAEDGIRFFHVTGVQTCALPISVAPPEQHLHSVVNRDVVVSQLLTPPVLFLPLGIAVVIAQYAFDTGGRSEERRVGKEGRLRRVGCHRTKESLTREQLHHYSPSR